jgi:hypothetical protein
VGLLFWYLFIGCIGENCHLVTFSDSKLNIRNFRQSQRDKPVQDTPTHPLLSAKGGPSAQDLEKQEIYCVTENWNPNEQLNSNHMLATRRNSIQKRRASEGRSRSLLWHGNVSNVKKSGVGLGSLPGQWIFLVLPGLFLLSRLMAFHFTETGHPGCQTKFARIIQRTEWTASFF